MPTDASANLNQRLPTPFYQFRYPAHIKKWAGTPSPGIPACPVRDPLHPLTGGAPEIRRALPAVALAAPAAAPAAAAAAAEAPPAAA